MLFPEGYVLRQIAVDACKQAGYEPTISSEGEDLDAIKVSYRQEWVLPYYPKVPFMKQHRDLQ